MDQFQTRRCPINVTGTGKRNTQFPWSWDVLQELPTVRFRQRKEKAFQLGKLQELARTPKQESLMCRNFPGRAVNVEFLWQGSR